MSDSLNEFIDHVISEMFKGYWVGDARNDLALARKQLYKSLTNQIEGYWSGNSAYQIMVKGGFLINARSNENKQLTPLGKVFMQVYRNAEINVESSEHKD